MANCQVCKSNVGCGCNLEEGMCSYCYQESKKVKIITPKSSK
jgi:hypothetical protein